MYDHVQNQSLNFHLNRETGKIIRAVQMGSQSFVRLLNILIFMSFPLVIRLALVSAAIGYLYTYEYILITVISMVVFLITNYFATEWKRKFSKEKSRKDQGQS